MSSDQRHEPRHREFIPVSVTALEHGSGRKLAGPLGGRLINISRHGACLLMSTPAATAEGLSTTSANGKDSLLEIRGTLPEGETPFTLAARAVWSTPMVVDDMHGLQMGVQFADQLEDGQLQALAGFFQGRRGQLAPSVACHESQG
jgi:hypothetical protein